MRYCRSRYLQGRVRGAGAACTPGEAGSAPTRSAKRQLPPSQGLSRPFVFCLRHTKHTSADAAQTTLSLTRRPRSGITIVHMTKPLPLSIPKAAACCALLFAVVLLSARATNCPMYPEHCGMLGAAAPAALEGLLLGALTGAATRNRAAGAAVGVASGVAAYARERDRCLPAAEQRRREELERAERARRAAEEQRWERWRAHREWAQNHRYVTHTIDDFGQRVRERRECVHVEYGVRY